MALKMAAPTRAEPVTSVPATSSFTPRVRVTPGVSRTRRGGREVYFGTYKAELMTNVLIRNVQARVAPNVSKQHQTGSFLT